MLYTCLAIALSQCLTAILKVCESSVNIKLIEKKGLTVYVAGVCCLMSSVPHCPVMCWSVTHLASGRRQHTFGLPQHYHSASIWCSPFPLSPLSGHLFTLPGMWLLFHMFREVAASFCEVAASFREVSASFHVVAASVREVAASVHEVPTSPVCLCPQFFRFYVILLPAYLAVQVLLVLSWQLKKYADDGEWQHGLYATHLPRQCGN